MHTELNGLLRRWQIDRIAAGGPQASNYLRAIMFDAVCHDYRVALVADTCSAQSDQVIEADLLSIKKFGLDCLGVTPFDEQYLRG